MVYRLSVKISLTESMPASVPVTLISMPPSAVPAGGVPLKVRLAASKLSHAGKGLPLARLALSVRLSPASTSAKVFAGKV
ncbi:hypothetical protein D3C85_1878230 [compost metagenome]